MALRDQFEIIKPWIRPRSNILDLGCGDGSLLALLTREIETVGYGIEIDPESIVKCMQKGVNVIQADLDEGLADFEDDAFDCVFLLQTLQAVHLPEKVLNEMLRVGKEGIITFPNMGHWKARAQLGLLGKMPVTKALPNTWYNTLNIHLCTHKDFENLCHTLGISIIEHLVLNADHRVPNFLAKFWPSMLGEIAVYRVCKK